MNASLYLPMGGLIAFISWEHDIIFTIISSLIFLAYFIIDKRLHLFLFMLGYYLMGSKGLLIGTSTYYDDISIASIIWLGAALISSAIWAIIWSNQRRKRYLLFPVALLIHILPPVGFVSWLNPLPTAGVVFPGLGFMGIFLFIIMIYCIAFFMDKKLDRNYFSGLIGFIMVLIISFLYINKQQILNKIHIKTVKTDFVYESPVVDVLKEYSRLIKYFKLSNKDHNITLLPENALGYYTDYQRVIWDDLKPFKRVYAGAYIRDTKERDKYNNVLLSIDNNTTKILYSQRVPVPISMWKPFFASGAKATIYKNAVVDIQNISTGIFICYEGLLTFPFLQTMIYEPKQLIGISNLWWAKRTNIEKIQNNTINLWGSLFGVPVLYSVNG